MIITIDGPAASGKSTVAKVLAKNLGFYYLYTGLLYRAVAYVLVEKFKILPELFPNLISTDLGFIGDIKYFYENGEPKVLYKNEDITQFLKNSLLDQASSIASANSFVREALISLQRDVANNYDIVADGRDCGSVVFPNADYKFYLTANVECRAKRKSLQEVISFDEALASLKERDARDVQRIVAPLKIPMNAIIIDNTELDTPKTIETFLNYLKN